RASMEMTLRWAERSKAYFEAHKGEVPWGSRQLPVASRQKSAVSSFEVQVSGSSAPTRNSKPETRNLSVDQEGELRSPGQTRASGPTQALFGIVQGGVGPDEGVVWLCSGGDGFGASSGVGFADCGDWVCGVCDWGVECGGASGG